MNPLKKVSLAPTSEIRTPVAIWCKDRGQRIYPQVCQKKKCACVAYLEWEAQQEGEKANG